MANSRRIYITLNSDKEKDRIIEELLSTSYSEADFIKETLYRLATQDNNLQLFNTNSNEKVQKGNKGNKKEIKVTKPKSNKKVQKGADSNNKDKKVTAINEDIKDTNDTQKVQNDDESINKYQNETDSDNKELMDNLSSNLDKYF